MRIVVMITLTSNNSWPINSTKGELWEVVNVKEEPTRGASQKRLGRSGRHVDKTAKKGSVLLTQAEKREKLTD